MDVECWMAVMYSAIDVYGCEYGKRHGIDGDISHEEG
jgi:hypothetical protein